MAKLFIGTSLRKQAEQAPWLMWLLWGLEGFIVWWATLTSRLLSGDWASATGYRLLRRLGPHLGKTRTIRRNLETAFPDLDAEALDRLTGEVWGNMGSVLAEFPHLNRIRNSQGEHRLECIDEGNAEVFRGVGRPAVFVTAHLANWEIVGAAIVRQSIPFAAVYTPMRNPFLDRMLRRARLSQGYDLIAREGAMKRLMRQLQQGVSVGLVVDQRVDSGVPLPFFGHDMLSSLTPAQLALRFSCELIPVQVQRRGGARFRVIFHAPLVPDPAIAEGQEQAIDLTRRLNLMFENWIRARPGEWLCSKRRWQKENALPHHKRGIST